MNNFKEFLKKICSSQRLILLHFLIYSLGLLSIASTISVWFVKFIFPNNLTKLNDYLFPLFFFPHKRFELFSYLFGAFILFIYYGICYYLMAKKKNFVDKFWVIREENLELYLISSLIINLFLLIPTNHVISTVIKGIIWIITFFGVFTFYRLRCRDSLKNFLNKMIFNLNNVLIASGILIFAIAFCFYLTDSLHGIRFRTLRFLFWIECLGVIYQIFKYINKFFRKIFGDKWTNPKNIYKFFREVFGDKLINQNSLFKGACYIILFLVLAQAAYMFSPFVFEEPKFINEYYNIPEKTILWPKEATNHKKTIIDNVTYTNEHVLLGDHRRYDIEHDKEVNPLPLDGTYTNVPKNSELINFINSINGGTKYYYDDRLQALCIIGPMSPSEKLRLQKIYNDSVSKTNINKLYLSSQALQNKIKKRIYTKEEKIFWKKNIFEFHWQILNRWVIHHHNHIMGPINEIMLGKNVNKIFMQYGWLNTIVIKNLMMLSGGVSYQNYFKVYYLFYYLYFILYILLLFFIFKQRIEYILLTSILSFAAFDQIGFQFIMLGPGLNPIRHFFDIFIIFFFVLYLRQNKFRFMALAYFFSIVAILNNSQFGIFVLMALLVAYGIQFLHESRRGTYYEAGFIIIVSLVSLITVFLTRFAFDPVSKYFLNGLLGFPLSQFNLLALLVLISFGYFILVNTLFFLTSTFKYLAIFLFFYSQELLIYYVWGKLADHWLDLVPIYALTGVLILQLLIENVQWLNQNKRRIFFYTLSMIIIVCYIPSVIKYYDAKKQFEMVFADHQVYQWNFDRLKAKSTMDPKFFADAVALIKEYSQQKKIYIISKYDNILPFLSNRYSGMPFFEVSNFCFSKEEVKQCIDTIKAVNPKYLFVDTDIERNINTDLVGSNNNNIGYLNQESISRVKRLNLLKEIFDSVKYNYKPIKKGLMITVYQRTD